VPSLRAFFTNMSVPMPLHRKVPLVFRNNLIKIVRRQSCCGHPGGPIVERQRNESRFGRIAHAITVCKKSAVWSD
jgi:hypothetical protein